MSSDDLRRIREEIVLRHIAGENDRDLEAVMATFTLRDTKSSRAQWFTTVTKRYGR
jgi:hypothetical protein